MTKPIRVDAAAKAELRAASPSSIAT